MRWQHPERGLLGPAEFIAIAEESGLIVPLGEHVLEAACREAARWADGLPDGPPRSISVNLSARQVSQPGLAPVAGMAKGLGLAVIAEGVETAAQVDELRRLGVGSAQGYQFAGPLQAEEFRALPAKLGAPTRSPR